MEDRETAFFFDGKEDTSMTNKNKSNKSAKISLSEILEYFDSLRGKVKQEYILSCNGDFDTIISDIKCELSKITKKDFQESMKDRKESLPTQEFLLQNFNLLPEPERSEMIERIPKIILATKKETALNFRNAYKYIIYRLRMKITALEYYHLPVDSVAKLAEEKAAQWYKKPKNNKNTTTHIEKSLEKAKKPFFDMPDSSASHLIFDILAAGDGIADLPARKKQVNHGMKYEVKASGDKRQVSMENHQGTTRVTVELADINKMSKAGKKLFILSMIKANEQSLHNGELTKDHISFPLQELVDYGLYSKLSSARRGFEIGVDTLTSIKIKGTVRKAPKSTATIQALEVPFTGAKIENNQCFIYLNQRIEWRFLAQYFTKLPKYYFKLSSRASDLLYYIFYLARQHTSNIAERGYFTVSLRAIQNLLQLPSEVNNRKPQQYIKIPIESAVEEIKTEHSQIYNNLNDFLLELVYDEKSGISEYLDNGYLKVSMKETFAESFIQQNRNKEKKQAQIEEKVKAINTVKSMKKKVRGET